MIASLNHSSSASSLGSALMSGATFTVRPSRQATEEHSRVLLLIDAQASAAPLDRVLLAGDQVLNGFDAALRTRRADFDVTEMEPKLPRALPRQSDRDCHRAPFVHRL